MYITSVPNRNSPPAILLRESYRDGNKVKNRTLSNLSDWPAERVEALRHVLKGGVAIGKLSDAFEIIRSRPHGHVSAVLDCVRRLGLDRLLAKISERERSLVLAMMADRITTPRSKLATSRGLSAETLDSSLGEILHVEAVQIDELYQAMDALVAQQEQVENALANRHLDHGSIVLYDVSSTYFEGRTCPLAKLGHSRDDKKDRLQIVFGLLTNLQGCPVAVEVFEGNTGDPKTLHAQVDKLRQRFAFERIILVGDRGMITSARIRGDLDPVEGLAWITALRAPAIQRLVKDKALQLSLFDKTDLAEISSPDFPGERLVVCRNPLLATERSRKRSELLAATEKELTKVVAATQRANTPLCGKAEIGLRVGKVLGHYKMGKHFTLTIEETRFEFRRDEESIQREQALDGIYVLRTKVPASALKSEEVVRTYKSLSTVERAFRSMKSIDLKIRPIHHRKAERVRAHVFLCMLAYYVEWHMRSALKPMLFDDEDKKAAEKQRSSIVAPARRSPAALDKAHTKKTAEGEPVHSFRTLLQDLSTIVKNRIQPKDKATQPFDIITRATALQQKALDLVKTVPRL
jgi:transposase